MGEVIWLRLRMMPFKTKLTFDWKTDWGKKYDHMDYTERPKRGVKVFDLKGYVTKMKGEQGEAAGGSMMGGMPPYIPTGMMMGGSRPASPSPMPTSMDDYIKRLDEKIAELEKQEAEEKAQAERERQTSSGVVTAPVDNKPLEKVDVPPVINTVPLAEKSEEELEKEIGDIFGHKVEEPKQEPIKEVPIYEEEKKDKISDIDFNKFIVPMPEEIEEDEYDVKTPVTHYEQVEERPNKLVEPTKEPEVTEIPRFTSPFSHTSIEQTKTDPAKTEPVSVGPIENIEKPKVNIDVDSVVVNNKPNDEDFFDDFFGSEDE